MIRPGAVAALALVCVLALLGATALPAVVGAVEPDATPAPTFVADATVPAEVAVGKMAPALAEAMAESDPHEMLTVIVTMREQPALSAIEGILDRTERLQRVVQILQATAAATQAPVRAYLAQGQRAGTVGEMIPFWVFNGLAVSATPDVILQLAARADVDHISANETFGAPEPLEGAAPPEYNIALIEAPALWELSYRGQGIVVASMDTGVDLYHPDLQAQWRGGTNSWYDPYGQHPTIPTDLSGHGTQTMGVMVGRDAGGTAIGVAPDAQWIAAKIFDDGGSATSIAIHASYQWVLDPDGNPSTPDAPHVVNSSWGYSAPGCNLEFQDDLRALRAAGIVPVFSAGNAGPYEGTSTSPANYPEALAVGATDDWDGIYYYSSRGPSACGEAETTFPELVAPGVDVWSTERYGLYASGTGTSLAAPHVSGALALLLSAYPSLTPDEQVAALLGGVVDLGSSGADNTFGHGRLDARAAYDLLSSGATPVPTATPTATEAPTEPPTPTPEPPTSTPTPPIDDVNLALNRPVTVSSYQDGGHDGSRAVDGDLATYWQTKKAVGKKVPTSEWIAVDLGDPAMIERITLEWDAHHATGYALQVSEDGAAWSDVFQTATGDGGTDSVDLPATTARFVRMVSTAWSDPALRVWLKEFEVYGHAGSSPTPTPTAVPTDTAAPTATATPIPTATPTPTSTATPPPADTPTPTPADPPTPTATPTEPPPTATPAAVSIHVGDLDASATDARNRWNAAVAILVHDADEGPVAGAHVSGVWSEGATGAASCTTDSTGRCEVALAGIKDNVAGVTFTLSDVALAGAVYAPADNHDPDGDSDGTTIRVTQPHPAAKNDGALVDSTPGTWLPLVRGPQAPGG